MSARSLGDRPFGNWLLGLFDNNPTCAHRLRIEITETEKAGWSPEDIHFVEEIRGRGVRVLLDDFGMGYNSFDLLKRIGLDGIKLDRLVVKDIENDPVDESLAIASVAISQRLGIQLVAEGVETEATFRALQELGVRAFQGHLFHRAESFPKEMSLALKSDSEDDDPQVPENLGDRNRRADDTSRGRLSYVSSLADGR